LIKAALRPEIWPIVFDMAAQRVLLRALSPFPGPLFFPELKNISQNGKISNYKKAGT
jgi:hypothetical protein